MQAIDKLNQRYGCKSIKLAVEGDKEQARKIRREHTSPNYLTDIRDILTIHI